ncbi:short-chain dehydrogenase [Mycolicibacterium celeriflavum]|uniref:coniferyl-alcohol dehydrogenase n=1 Tax=Mycolicibacterium celeriflavum TaxID=1249101 RepID=UPI0007FE8A22|nr:coniferyl-alcohol dehydrogenase [Mycolicibacterium celeriflavum]OBG24344.1 short-chain dehydrogenase [Mycolicibacterium celeriflavum]
MSGNRKIVVVGAASGIGAAVATHFHERGDHVLAVDRREQRTAASEYARCDLRDGDSIRDLLAGIGSGWDMLAHVAGVPGTAPAADVLKVNYLGMRLMTEGMLPLLREGGSIVAVASTAALGWEQRTETLSGLLELTEADAVERWQSQQDPDYPVYSTSKQAVILYAKRLAGQAWAKYGVRVNTVSPGPVETPILTDFEQTMGKEVLDMCRATVGRHASVDDIVPAISFLGSPAARWITGQDLQVDAGFISSMTAGTPVQLL